MLYLIGLSGCRVKVGRTANITARTLAHRSTFKDQIEWMHIFPPDSGQIEREIKATLASIGQRERGTTEVFSGVSKDVAIVICRAEYAKRLGNGSPAVTAECDGADYAKRLAAFPNISAFCREHRLPLRTIMRIKAGGEPRAGTASLLDRALKAVRNRSTK